MLGKVKYYKQLLAKKQVKEVIGSTRVFLDGNCRCMETNLANFITDSFIQYVSKHTCILYYILCIGISNLKLFLKV